MKKLITMFITACCICWLCKGTTADEQIMHYAAPTILPHVRPEMQTAGFWVSRNPHADEIIIPARIIPVFNKTIQENLKLTRNMTEFPSTVSGVIYFDKLQNKLSSLRNNGYFTSEGIIADQKFFNLIENNMNLKLIGKILPVKFGFILFNADQRQLPTLQHLYVTAGNVDFDELQENALDVGTPVEVIHQTKDGEWYYVLGPASEGWIKADLIGLCEQYVFQQYLSHKQFLVVTRAKIDIFIDDKLTQFYGSARMGSRFFVKDDSDPEIFQIYLPSRKREEFEISKAYISRQGVHIGYLDHTARHVIQQAFEMLNTPYGWGGMNNEQDCSQFIQEIYATMGIQLPRNSSDQAQIGKELAAFTDETKDSKKLDVILHSASPGNSMFYMKGHIILFLGVVDDVPFAIHDIWAYRERIGREDVARVLNRVAVTDLSLGTGSRKGSLLSRILQIRMIQ
ncbi:MAG: SH3 domain-containing protein [Candidatus Omnitrophica bacterium]|nr:SH3 domain-containing protein [Candidatus Omnitrophota bacterium]